jgi:hypothetical protein
MKDVLIQKISDTALEDREGRLIGDAVISNACKTPIVSPAFRIPKDNTVVLDRSNMIEIAKQIEQEKRHRIVSRSSENGISTSCDGTDKTEINDRIYYWGYAAANGAVVVGMKVFLPKFVVGQPASLFLGKWLGMAVVAERIDFPKLSDNAANCKAGGFTHLKTPMVSRECVRPSKRLPGSHFYCQTPIIQHRKFLFNRALQFLRNP